MPDAPREPWPPSDPDHANPDWFREPTRREHAIGAGLFIAFGLFFLLLFFLQSGWWFRWIILILGVFSLLRGLRHALRAMTETAKARKREESREDESELK